MYYLRKKVVYTHVFGLSVGFAHVGEIFRRIGSLYFARLSQGVVHGVLRRVFAQQEGDLVRPRAFGAARAGFDASVVAVTHFV